MWSFTRMVQLRLPANSRMTTGHIWPKPVDAVRTKSFKVYRWNPDDEENHQIDSYDVDLDTCGPMVLAALIKIKNEIDPTLSFGVSFTSTEIFCPILLHWPRNWWGEIATPINRQSRETIYDPRRTPRWLQRQSGLRRSACRFCSCSSEPVESR